LGMACAPPDVRPSAVAVEPFSVTKHISRPTAVGFTSGRVTFPSAPAGTLYEICNWQTPGCLGVTAGMLVLSILRPSLAPSSLMFVALPGRSMKKVALEPSGREFPSHERSVGF